RVLPGVPRKSPWRRAPIRLETEFDVPLKTRTIDGRCGNVCPRIAPGHIVHGPLPCSTNVLALRRELRKDGLLVHYSNAVSAIARAQAGGTPTIDFVSPAVSALLSAWALADRDAAARIGFGSACAGYAANIGLTGVLSGNPIPVTTVGEWYGRSYTPLASLCTHAEVDHCNALINSVLRKQLEQHAPDLVKRVFKVIGELHDNIASHACGRGYSAAQTYESGKPRIEFAIADCGRGLRRNAREVDPHIGSDSEAIEWAF